MNRIREQVAEATEGIGGGDHCTLRDMLATQQAMARDIEALRASGKRRENGR